MSTARLFALATAVCCLFSNGPARADPADPTLNPCEAAGTLAERAAGLPAGILLAIGRIESGKWDAFRRRVAPWPWTMNAAGRGQLFGSKDEAVGTVGALLAGGTRSIDVGCFQVNLLHHPSAFANLDEGFDPDATARYAARFLISLFARTGSWEGAVAAYHSADPALGGPYQQQVYATWASPGVSLSQARQTMATARPVESPPPFPVPEKIVSMPAVYNGVQVWTPVGRGGAPKIVAMPAPGAAQAGGVPGLPAVTYSPPPGVTLTLK